MRLGHCRLTECKKNQHTTFLFITLVTLITFNYVNFFIFYLFYLVRVQRYLPLQVSEGESENFKFMFKCIILTA